MLSKPSINTSENAVVINLEWVQLEEIVEKKMLYFLQQDQNLNLGLLKSFYKPVEQALIEVCLEICNGNQIQASKRLGINRNTLKKKIIEFNINIKTLLTMQKRLNYPMNRIFLSSLFSLKLLSVCRVKLALARIKNQIPETNALKTFCQPVEGKIVQIILDHCKGNTIKAAKLLGINRNTLKKKRSLVWAKKA